MSLFTDVNFIFYVVKCTSEDENIGITRSLHYFQN